jgi:hypothetical protein
MLLEKRAVRLDSVHSILKLSHLVLETLKSSFHHGGNFSELSNIECNSSEGLDFLECSKSFKLSSTRILGILSFGGKILSLDKELGNLSKNAFV